LASLFLIFFSHAPTPTLTSTLSLHDALPIYGLVRDDAAVRLLHRLDQRLLVERLQRSRIDDFDRDSFLFGLLRGRERLVHKEGIDRKSTRLNSSHRTISYAVFCLKKKKKIQK